jgi:purine-nucleoside phosphorylase
MPLEDDTVIIESRKGSREERCEPVAILACTEADRQRFCRLATPIATSIRTVYNARLQEIIHGGRSVTLAGPILGAPQAVLVLEKLIALGSRLIIVFGWCGSMQPDVKIGDWLLPDYARSEEGTSVHYPMKSEKFSPDADLLARLQGHFQQTGVPVRLGPIWTTDALLRETVHKIRAYGKDGLLAVEMELSALFHVAAYRKVRLVGLLVVSDELFTLKWQPGFGSTSFKRSCNQACQTLLDFCSRLPPEFLTGAP